MSTEQNTEWFAAARENFEDAVATSNWAFALAIIDDVRKVGFSIEADALQVELNKAMMDPV